ncbi:PREDICTED: uncharacterized protein LOC102009124 [Chinchilla lanigera]|nr:PREDICTED: uncharacterized protein LOC102009124 [Chinchilla lanigera]
MFVEEPSTLTLRTAPRTPAAPRAPVLRRHGPPSDVKETLGGPSFPGKCLVVQCGCRSALLSCARSHASRNLMSCNFTSALLERPPHSGSPGEPRRAAFPGWTRALTAGPAPLRFWPLPRLPLGDTAEPGWSSARSLRPPRRGRQRAEAGSLANPSKSWESEGERDLSQQSGRAEAEEMSSLVKEDLEKKLFKPLSQNLYEFIEIEFSVQDRYYLCVSVTKNEEVKIIMVKHYRIGLDEKYEVTKKWSLNDLQMIDGKEADTDNPFFDLHFKKVYSLEAYSCASKYAFARTVNKLNHAYLKKDLQIVNFDSTYINDDSIWSSNNKDCLVLMRICFYAFNLVCLSLCPLPL